MLDASCHWRRQAPRLLPGPPLDGRQQRPTRRPARESGRVQRAVAKVTADAAAKPAGRSPRNQEAGSRQP
jgi:hypothetical protein